MNKLFLLIFLVFGNAAFAESPSGQFEIVDVSGQISGDLAGSSDAARSAWTKSCQDWKTESKDLNKTNEVLVMSCNNPTCSFVESGKWQCFSTGTYKVKTAGVRVSNKSIAPPLPEPPVAAPLPPEHEIETAPPETIVEIVPTSRPGFVWIQGYWGWEGHRHMWVPGHWTNARPGYIWVGNNWGHRGHGWHFEAGRWEMHH